MGKVIALFCFFLFANVVFAEDPCKKQQNVVFHKETSATASVWSNARNSEGSLRYETAALLKEAEAKLSFPRPADFSCSGSCVVEEKPFIVFDTIPTKFVSDSSDEDYCKQLLDQTTSQPFRYNNNSFPSMDDLSSWFSDFSQGKGKDGSDLYSRCDKDCSPQYFTRINKIPNSYQADSSVLCGLPRDKSDNTYNVRVSVVWGCKSR